MLYTPVKPRESNSSASSVSLLMFACKARAYELRDGQIIESVLMPYDDGRRTACISSQAGCGMGCVFCATGQMGFSRQLSSAEIFEQAQIFSTELKRRNERLSNVVFMGMGEPMANYDNVMVAVRRLNTDLGIGARHITISTVGLAPRIRKLAEEDIQVNLAVSLHQANDAKRSALMPVNKRYPLPELLDACRFYIEKTNRRISFEWALIRDDTDTEETARELGRLLRGMLCHVNVIPLNPTANFGGKPTSKVRYMVWMGCA
jgi:23S rRNA (adenine2503-C2)-methyltransferase